MRASAPFLKHTSTQGFVVGFAVCGVAGSVCKTRLAGCAGWPPGCSGTGFDGMFALLSEPRRLDIGFSERMAESGILPDLGKKIAVIGEGIDNLDE